jgi:hypothetical protein
VGAILPDKMMAALLIADAVAGLPDRSQAWSRGGRRRLAH